MDMRIVIVGAGNTGRELASRLSSRQSVLLLDTRDERFAGLEKPLEPIVAATALIGGPGLRCVRADGTSRLVLNTLFDPETRCALVAATASDEINLEVGRLGKTIGYEPLIAVVRDPNNLQAFDAERITGINSARLLADQMERSVRHLGALVPVGIGLGRGELVEVRLVRTSPVLERPLKNLAPHRWRVAAVFRANELIVPTGETRLQVDDRVLLVGDPAILPTVAEYLRLGTAQFPRQYGANLVTLEFKGLDEDLAAEAEYLAAGSLAVCLVRGTPDAKDTTPEEDVDPLTQPTPAGAVQRSTFALPSLAEPSFGRRLARQRPGLVVCRPMARSLGSKLMGRRGQDAELCDRVRAPVLFARSKTPYRKILLPVSDSDLNIRSAELAIDISRQLGASLTAVNVDLPRAISGLAEDAVHREVMPVRRICELYDVRLDYRHHEGNPIRRLVGESSRHDLVIVARHVSRRDSAFNPDVAMRLARQAQCSTVVLTVRPEE